MGTDSSSSALRAEALGIVAELDLLGRLCPLGRAEIVGSVALDLVVKRDIDVHVLLAEPGLYPAADAVTHDLLDHPRVREVRITDYRAQGSLKVAVDAYPGASGDWSIDIWLTERPEETAFAWRDALLAVLTPNTAGPSWRSSATTTPRALARRPQCADLPGGRRGRRPLGGGVRPVASERRTNFLNLARFMTAPDT